MQINSIEDSVIEAIMYDMCYYSCYRVKFGSAIFSSEVYHLQVHFIPVFLWKQLMQVGLDFVNILCIVRQAPP